MNCKDCGKFWEECKCDDSAQSRAEGATSNAGLGGKDRAHWLADKIPALGDYAKEAAIVLRQQADKIEAQQATIDRLMMEYCPYEMTPEQIVIWARNQRSVPNAKVSERPAQTDE